MRKALMMVATIILGISLLMPISVYAADCPEGQVPTAILGNGGCAKADEDGIWEILRLVVNIMSVGVGILGVVGITVVGIQYLTAGGSEEKTRTAKRRMLEIVIGLAVYAVAYGLLSWLLPGFSGV